MTSSSQNVRDRFNFNQCGTPSGSLHLTEITKRPGVGYVQLFDIPPLAVILGDKANCLPLRHNQLPRTDAGRDREERLRAKSGKLVE